jgi:hypothetical protein
VMRGVLLVFALYGCAGGVVVQDRPQAVSVPVTVPCVAGARPAAVTAMKAAHPDWYDKSVKQKAEIAAAQALRHKNYGAAVNAATSACQ